MVSLSADLDDSASDDTDGSVAALFSYETRKAMKRGVHQDSMPRYHFQGQIKKSWTSSRNQGIKHSNYWAEYAGHVRLVKCQRECELRGIEMSPWYFLY